MGELLGVTVDPGPIRSELREPVIDASLAGGAARLAANRTHAILRADGIGTFEVAEGRRVSFEPQAGADERAVAMWLYGTVAALLLAQRGEFALHASVVDVDGRGLAISGPRRVGKSTTALRLMQLGHALVTDDVSPLRTSSRLTVHPYARPVYVLTETARALGLDVSEARPVLAGHPKLALHAAAHDPIELSAIAVVEPSADARTVAVRPAGGAEAHWSVLRNTYRASLLRELWQTQLFGWAADVARKVPVHVVTRPAETWSVDAVAETLVRLALSGSRSAP